jgi:hypothetical protein
MAGFVFGFFEPPFHGAAVGVLHLGPTEPGPNELFVQEPIAHIDVGEDSVVAVAALPVELQPDFAFVDVPAGEFGRLGAKSLDGMVRFLGFGRIDADQPDALAAGDHERIAVDDALDPIRARRDDRRGSPPMQGGSIGEESQQRDGDPKGPAGFAASPEAAQFRHTLPGVGARGTAGIAAACGRLADSKSGGSARQVGRDEFAPSSPAACSASSAQPCPSGRPISVRA